jgi:hypothetical protein
VEAPPVALVIATFLLFALAGLASWLYQQIPEPLTGIVHAHRPADLPKGDFAVIVTKASDMAEVQKAVAESARKDLRWLATLLDAKRATLVPEGSPLAVVESPSSLNLLNGSGLYKVRVIDGEHTGVIGYVTSDSLQRADAKP